MASANETPARVSTTTAFNGLLPLTPLLSASHVNLEHVFYSYAKYPDLMNMTKRKPTMVPEPRLEKKSDRGKKGNETDRSDADREKKIERRTLDLDLFG